MSCPFLSYSHAPSTLFNPCSDSHYLIFPQCVPFCFPPRSVDNILPITRNWLASLCWRFSKPTHRLSASFVCLKKKKRKKKTKRRTKLTTVYYSSTERLTSDSPLPRFHSSGRRGLPTSTTLHFLLFTVNVKIMNSSTPVESDCILPGRLRTPPTKRGVLGKTSDVSIKAYIRVGYVKLRVMSFYAVLLYLLFEISCIYIYVYIYVCVCVCVRERERER